MTLFLLAAATVGFAQDPAPAGEMRLMRFTTVHGDTVVFTYASDLWMADRRGEGYARRLTTHAGEERRARISPDGRQVAFAASYDGNPDVYVMPLEGGPPRRLTYDANGEGVVGWTPDGKIAYTSTAGSFTPRQARLWTVAPSGGLPDETPLLQFADGSFFPGGKRVVYNRMNSHNQNWRRYRGGSQGRISLYDFATNAYSELPSGRENSWFPMVIGNGIVYASDRNQGTVNLYRHDLGTKKDVQLTRYKDGDVRWPSTDGKTVVFERDGYLHAYDVATGKDERLSFRVRGDELSARPYVLKVGRNIDAVAASPNGSRLAVGARGEIFNVAANGDARNLTATPGVRERAPQWSRDGKTIAYLTDASGEFQIVAQPATGGEAKTLSAHTGPEIRSFTYSPDGARIAYFTADNRLMVLDPATRQSKPVYKQEFASWGTYYDWSPDGRWIAYSAPVKTGFGAIYLYEVATGQTTKVTEGRYDDLNPTFDLSGKYLYFTSARSFSPGEGRFEQSLKVDDADRIFVIPLTKDLPNPLFPRTADDGDGAKESAAAARPETRIDLDGIADRAVVLPLPGNWPGLLFGAKEGVFHYTRGKLRRFDLRTREAVAIFEGQPGAYDLNPGRTKLAYFAGDTLGLADVKPGQAHGAGRVETRQIETRVDPRAEWRQMFWEAWRFERDYFLRADMGGLDWRAVGRHYERYLDHASHRSDLSYVLGLMVGELGTSHAYVDDPAPTPSSTDRAASAAALGADSERAAGWLRFRRIYRGTMTDETRRGPR